MRRVEYKYIVGAVFVFGLALMRLDVQADEGFDLLIAFGPQVFGDVDFMICFVFRAAAQAA